MLHKYLSMSLAKFLSLTGWVSRLANQYSKLYFHVKKPAHNYTYVISKTCIVVLLCESTISCMLVCQPAQLACSNLEFRQTQLMLFHYICKAIL